MKRLQRFHRLAIAIAVPCLLPAAPAFSRTTVSVLVAYTDDARAAAGGEVNIRNEIIAAIDDGNLALTNSQTEMEVVLAGTMEVAVNEGNYTNLTQLNTDLANPASTVFRGVHTMRNQVSADMVYLVFSGIQANGQAHGVCGSTAPCDQAFHQHAFASGQRALMLTDPILIHELGHVMGLRHDRTRDCGSEATTCLTAAHPYAYGHIDPVAPTDWGTIMAGGRPFPLVDFFSHPGLTHPTSGQVLGVADRSDASRSLRNNRWIFQSWRVPHIVQTNLAPLLLQ